jgi:hypothetical protein
MGNYYSYLALNNYQNYINKNVKENKLLVTMMLNNVPKLIGDPAYPNAKLLIYESRDKSIYIESWRARLDIALEVDSYSDLENKLNDIKQKCDCAEIDYLNITSRHLYPALLTTYHHDKTYDGYLAINAQCKKKSEIIST